MQRLLWLAVPTCWWSTIAEAYQQFRCPPSPFLRRLHRSRFDFNTSSIRLAITCLKGRNPKTRYKYKPDKEMRDTISSAANALSAALGLRWRGSSGTTPASNTAWRIWSSVELFVMFTWGNRWEKYWVGVVQACRMLRLHHRSCRGNITEE